MRLQQNPHHFLLHTGLALVLASFLIDQDKTLDIHIHDTYYIIAQTHLFLAFGFLVGLLWVLYLLLRKILYSKILTRVHIISTIVIVLFLVFIFQFNQIFPQYPRRYLDLGKWSHSQFDHPVMKWMFYGFISLLLFQCVFVINIIAGIAKRFIK
ncbi:MAG TPA: hypothetical protein VGC29_11230 [Flavisolibacter sp.]